MHEGSADQLVSDERTKNVASSSSCLSVNQLCSIVCVKDGVEGLTAFYLYDMQLLSVKAFTLVGG